VKIDDKARQEIRASATSNLHATNLASEVVLALVADSQWRAEIEETAGKALPSAEEAAECSIACLGGCSMHVVDGKEVSHREDATLRGHPASHRPCQKWHCWRGEWHKPNPRVVAAIKERDQIHAAHFAAIKTALGYSSKWPADALLERLGKDVEHFMSAHDCDADGWEIAQGAGAAATAMAPAIRAALGSK
jgi:hypothetical protein